MLRCAQHDCHGVFSHCDAVSKGESETKESLPSLDRRGLREGVESLRNHDLVAFGIADANLIRRAGYGKSLNSTIGKTLPNRGKVVDLDTEVLDAAAVEGLLRGKH